MVKEREYMLKRAEEEHKRKVEEAEAAGNPAPEALKHEDTEDVKRINKMASFL